MGHGEGEEEDDETSEEDNDEEDSVELDDAHSPTRRPMDGDSGVNRARRLSPMDQDLNLNGSQTSKLNDAIEAILGQVINPLLRKGTHVYLWLGNSGLIWGFEVDERTCEDYIYCEKCEMYVDFWKYEHDEMAAGHKDHVWRYVTPRELKGLVRECRELRCFEEMG